jgi:hypothetical protein
MLGTSKSPKGKAVVDSSSEDSGVANFGKTNWKASEDSMGHNMEYLGSDGDMGEFPALQDGKPRNGVGTKVVTAHQETVDSVLEASSGDKSGKLPSKFVGSWDSTKGRMEWINVDMEGIQLVRDPFSTSYFPHVNCPPKKVSTNQQVDGSCTLQKLESPSLIQPPSEQLRSEQKIGSGNWKKRARSANTKKGGLEQLVSNEGNDSFDRVAGEDEDCIQAPKKMAMARKGISQQKKAVAVEQPRHSS